MYWSYIDNDLDTILHTSHIEGWQQIVTYMCWLETYAQLHIVVKFMIGASKALGLQKREIQRARKKMKSIDL